MWLSVFYKIKNTCCHVFFILRICCHIFLRIILGLLPDVDARVSILDGHDISRDREIETAIGMVQYPTASIEGVGSAMGRSIATEGKVGGCGEGVHFTFVIIGAEPGRSFEWVALAGIVIASTGSRCQKCQCRKCKYQYFFHVYLFF